MRHPQRLYRRAGMVNQDRITSLWDVGGGVIQEMNHLLLRAGSDESIGNSQGKMAADLADEEARMIADDRESLLEDIREANRRHRQYAIEAPRTQEELVQRLVAQARAKGYPPDHVPQHMLERVLGSGRGQQILRGPDGLKL